MLKAERARCFCVCPYWLIAKNVGLWRSTFIMDRQNFSHAVLMRLDLARERTRHTRLCICVHALHTRALCSPKPEFRWLLLLSMPRDVIAFRRVCCTIPVALFANAVENKDILKCVLACCLYKCWSDCYTPSKRLSQWHPKQLWPKHATVRSTLFEKLTQV